MTGTAQSAETLATLQRIAPESGPPLVPLMRRALIRAGNAGAGILDLHEWLGVEPEVMHALTLRSPDVAIAYGAGVLTRRLELWAGCVESIQCPRCSGGLDVV